MIQIKFGLICFISSTLSFLLLVSDDGLKLPLPYRNESEQYQLFYEQLKDLMPYAAEFQEFFDGLNNIGIVNARFLNEDTSFYAYFDKNELLITLGQQCSVYLINETLSEIPFNIIEVDGKPHIATPLTLLSHQVSQKVAYLGSTNRFVRGIPVRQWLTCAKNFDIEYKITISYSSSILNLLYFDWIFSKLLIY